MPPVYGTLRRLYQAGSLKSYVVPSDEGPQRKCRLNDRGRNALDQSTKMGRSREPSITCSTGGAPPMAQNEPANDVATYAASVRSALASLPDAERASLLEDLRTTWRRSLASPIFRWKNASVSLRTTRLSSGRLMAPGAARQR